MNSNLSSFLASPEYSRFTPLFKGITLPINELKEPSPSGMCSISNLHRCQQAYPEVPLSAPVSPDRLVINEQYWMVHTIHCWDDICHHDHECRLEYGLEKVIYLGEKKEQIHEFLNEHNTYIPIYIGALQGELTCYFLYQYR